MRFFRQFSAMATPGISSLRYKYMERSEAFKEDSLVKKEPFSLFREWFEELLKDPAVNEPNAMCLSTVDKNGQPRSRYVLMKGYTDDGITFFTNYESNKARDMLENPKVALNFYWFAHKRQIRVEGVVSKVTQEESEEYFRSRPVDSQMSASISQQSRRVPSRAHLDELMEGVKKETEAAGGKVPMPNWGGYLVKPQLFEFWQGQSNRLHDRIVFRRSAGVEKEVDGVLTKQGENGWVFERLAP
ncbi:pyridoxine/pyridoxamine 5'-phosphate oxidase-like [Phlebotomus argentipes]|uniref:pyridoxine/pyridoxamine 5'-phosphate oxidase-like n=1 Tax=Phlebotomus argentipes TaxID=94469 RepID=UPI002892D95B|nr:pyridoxine/pyridoxamine 5'-phosphate oxidase-like [Phlebotomus argentipes]